MTRTPCSEHLDSGRRNDRTEVVRIGRRPVDVIKRSTVSTALLKASQPLHMRPINLVVFQGSHANKC